MASAHPSSGGAQRQRALVAVASAALLVAAVVAVAAMGGGAGAQQSPVLLGSTGAKLDWSAFDQQLHSDWVRRQAAHKHGESSADAALQERKEADERRMLAQKRLEVQCACRSAPSIITLSHLCRAHSSVCFRHAVVQVKKVAEEKEMEKLERNIELEASNQLAAHNTQLSDAIVQAAPAAQSNVVFEGHFQPGFDAKSAGEAAAELAAWGPGSNANWARVLAEQRKASNLAAEQQPYQQQLATYNPVLPQQRTAAMSTGPGSTGGDALHQAWVAHDQLRQLAKTEDLADIKDAALRAESHPASVQDHSALTQALARYLQHGAHPMRAVASKPASQVKVVGRPVGHVAMSSALAGAPLQAGFKSEAAKVKELSLEAKLAHEQAQNAILKEKLKEEQLEAAKAQLARGDGSASASSMAPSVEEVTAATSADNKKAVKEVTEAADIQTARRVPVVDGKSASEQAKWAKVIKMEQQERRQRASTAMMSSHMKCCDDACETISVHCAAPAAIVSSQPAVSFGVQASAGGASARDQGAPVPKDATEKQLLRFLMNGTPAQKHEAAGLLYTDTETHEGYGADGHDHTKAPTAARVVPKVHQQLIKPVKEVLIKGIRRCCDSSCNYVSNVCPNTHDLDKFAVEEYAAGKGPTKSQLQDWLVSGTQVEKDEAAAVFYGISHGVVAKEKKKLAKKEAAIKAAEAPKQARDADGDVETHALARSHGHSHSAEQASNVKSEVQNIIGDLAAEGH